MNITKLTPRGSKVMKMPETKTGGATPEPQIGVLIIEMAENGYILRCIMPTATEEMIEEVSVFVDRQDLLLELAKKL